MNLLNLPNLLIYQITFYSFIKTYAIGMGWVSRAGKGSGESETIVSENSPTDGTQETPGGATA